MKKKKSPTVKAIVDRHIADKDDIIREEDMKSMKLGVEEDSAEWPQFGESQDSSTLHTDTPANP